jgi:hypothetical protein
LQVSVVHTLLSLQLTAVPAWQVPPPQVSPAVQAFPSSQAFVLFVWMQFPVATSQLSVVHGLLSLQFGPPPPLQIPLRHVSPEVQAFPSSHAFVLLLYMHPVAGLHVSVVQTLLSLQTAAVPAWHVPPPHASPVVQAFPSSHGLVLFV